MPPMGTVGFHSGPVSSVLCAQPEVVETSKVMYYVCTIVTKQDKLTLPVC